VKAAPGASSSKFLEDLKMGPDIIVPIGAFAMIVAIVCLPFYFKSRERREMQATLRVAIEKGQPVPPEVIEAMTRAVKTPPTRLRDLRTGVIWLAIGIGIGLATYFGDFIHGDGDFDGIGIACIPAVIGVAFIVLSFFNPNKEERV
jgi:Na+/H+ antiporter NhaD/arsenite permease-like protein